MSSQKPTEQDVEESSAVEVSAVDRTAHTLSNHSISSKASRALHRFQDHFTLEVASSNVRFRSSNNIVKVFSSPSSQFILEEDFDENTGTRKVVAKHLNDATAALRGLRAIYTLVVLFFTGFLIVFCLELLLFLVIGLTVECGITSKSDVHVGRAIGVILSLPVYVSGLSSSLVIAGHYVIDTWDGHTLVKRFVFGKFNGVLTEWASFFIFLGIPILVMAGALYAGSVYWWTITALTWFSCVFAFYLLFAATIVWFENRACLDIMKNRYEHDDDSLPQLFKRSVLLRQTARFSGCQNTVYLAAGAIQDATGDDKRHHLSEATHHTTMSLYSKLTTFKFLSTDGGLGLFETLEEPVRTYTVEDARGIRPYVTANTWSLEKLYCRSRNSRYVAITKGPQALTVAQMRSSFACAIIGNVMVLLLMIGALVWLGLPTGGVILLVVLVVVFGMVPGARISYRLYQMTKDIAFRLNSEKSAEEPLEEDLDERHFMEGASEGVYQVWETFRVTRATQRLCWVFYVFEVGIFFWFPAICLFLIGNYAIATLFLFVALFTALREFLNAALVLEEVGNMDLIRGTTPEQQWLKQSRLNTIIKDISRSQSKGAWTAVLYIFLLIFLGLFGLAISQGSSNTSDFQFTFMPNFEYIPAPDLEYPTCTIGKGIESLGTSQTSIADFAFVAVLAYRNPNITQVQLDQWFGNSSDGTAIAVDMQDFVDAYRNETDIGSAVYYKLIEFPASNLALVAVRGTTNAWDALTDAQLWSSAFLFQGLRLILPLGFIWTPILDVMVQIVSWLESSTIEQVAFYKQTTAFVNYLKNSSLYDNVQITGHSLGGGLAMITGAQTDTPAVALSGPNAMISKKTFNPPITENALNTLTFNIIPDRDIVPRLDDVARLFQKIDCTAPFNDFAACHDGRRSLCEILYTCGTRDRPALCDCVIKFGYPEPTPKEGETATFQEACASLIAASG